MRNFALSFLFLLFACVPWSWAEPTPEQARMDATFHAWQDPKTKLWGFKSQQGGGGGWKIAPQFYGVSGRFCEGLCAVDSSEDRNFPLFGYIDNTGNWVIQPAFSKAEAFQNGYARVTKAGLKQNVMTTHYTGSGGGGMVSYQKGKKRKVTDRPDGASGYVDANGKVFSRIPGK